MKSIKINSDLWKRLEAYSAQAGYSSPEELVEHLIEKELSRSEQQSDREEIDRRLKGLGYVD